jgi:hypothetical protein
MYNDNKGDTTMETSKKETYQGWANHATWAVSLWLNNEKGSYQELVSILKRQKDNYKAADQIKEWVEEMAPDLGPTLWADLLTASLGDVDWLEIAENNRD